MRRLFSVMAAGVLLACGHDVAGPNEPAGTKILYVRPLPIGFDSLLQMDPDGSHKRPASVITTSISGLRVSPSGNYLMYAGGGNGWMLLDRKGEVRGGPYDIGYIVDWFSDESGVVSSSGRISVIDFASGVRRDLTQGPSDLNASLSPEGTQIIFERQGLPGGPRLYIIGVDGSNLRPFTADTVLGQSPMWSPDGKAIAYNQYSVHPEETGVFVSTPDLLNRQRWYADQCEAFAPTWTPDSKRIFCAANVVNGHSFNVLSLSATHVDTLANWSSPWINSPLQTAMSPSGADVLVHRSAGIAAVDTRTGALRMLAQDTLFGLGDFYWWRGRDD